MRRPATRVSKSRSHHTGELGQLQPFLVRMRVEAKWTVNGIATIHWPEREREVAGRLCVRCAQRRAARIRAHLTCGRLPRAPEGDRDALANDVEAVTMLRRRGFSGKPVTDKA